MPSKVTKYNPALIEERERAINDMKSYIGESTFYDLVQEVKRIPDTRENRQSVANAMELLAGVSGFPAACFIAKYIGKGLS